MGKFMLFIGFLFICFLHIGMTRSMPKPFLSTTLSCYAYKKVNGRVLKKPEEDDCIFGNTCCYAAEFTNVKTKTVVETGGCEDEYRHVVATHPLIGSMLPFTATYLCEEGACIEQSTARGNMRLCACTENNCNINGIDDTMKMYHERVQKGLVKEPPDVSSVLEKTVKILIDG